MRKAGILLSFVMAGLSGNIYSQSLNCDSTCLTPQPISVNKVNIATTSQNVGQFTFGAKCGPSAGSVLPTAPSTFLCDSGTASSVATVNTAGDISYIWSCTNSNGSQTTCTAFQREVGVCGSSNGTTISSTPTNLCSSGGSTAFTFVGSQYSWSCKGNYGTPASCSATYTPPQPPPVCQWTSTWSNNITVGTTYTVLNPAYVAYGSLSDADFGSAGLPGISEAYQFYGLPWAPATTPSGMYWVLSLDSFNGVTHSWKYALVGTPTNSGSFGGSYVASCGWAQGASRTDMTFFSYTVNAAPAPLLCQNPLTKNFEPAGTFMQWGVSTYQCTVFGLPPNEHAAFQLYCPSGTGVPDTPSSANGGWVCK